MPGSSEGSKLVLIVFAILLLLAATPSSQAQEAGNVEDLEMLSLIQTPTAGVLKSGQYQIDLTGYGNNGINFGIGIGIFERFMFGVSYGGDAILGYDDPTWNELPGVLVKYRFIEENNALPAITFGFDMQGYGTWYDDVSRYLHKAPGGFAALSRNFMSDYGRFGVHGGLNYNSIEDDDEGGLDFFIGADLSLNDQLTILAEYDFALDDNKEDGSFGEEPYGYLNLGVRFVFARAFILEFDATDILDTSVETTTIGRQLKIIYIENFTF